MTRVHLFSYPCLVVALNAIVACAPLTPNLDQEFGKTVRSLREQQTMHPNASSNTAVTSLDAQAAASAVDRYNKSYRQPAPQQNVFTIGVGR